MTREEDIQAKALEIYPRTSLSNQHCEWAFCKGAEWADDTNGYQIKILKERIELLRAALDLFGDKT